MLSEVAAALVLGFGASRVHNGTLTAGGLIAYLLYLDLLFTPVQQLSQVFDGYQQAEVGLRRIRDLLRTPTSVPPAEHPVALPPHLGQLEIDDVVFTYQGTTTPAIAGVSLTIPAGQTVALVGETGAGKSTMVKLVARYYDPTSGAVRVGGNDLRTVAASDYRHRLGRRSARGVPVPGHDSRRHRLRPAGGDRRRGRGGRPGGRRAHDDRPPARRLPASRSASAGADCQRGSASSSRWRGPSSSNRRSCCSTRRRQRST